MFMAVLNLSEISTPGAFVVVRVEGHGVPVTQLKRLGICENQVIELVQTGNPAIVQVAGSRVGISRVVIECVYVEAYRDSEAG